MGDEPRNAASEAARILSELILDPERSDQLAAMVADEFIAKDHRKLVGAPEMDKAAWLTNSTWFVRTAGGLATRQREVLAVRGDRLSLSRYLFEYHDGSLRELLHIGDFGGDPLQLRRLVIFDTDDLDAALAELDRLHAEND